MGDYLVVSASVASERFIALKDDARIAGMAVSDLAPNTWLAVNGPHPQNTRGRRLEADRGRVQSQQSGLARYWRRTLILRAKTGRPVLGALHRCPAVRSR